MKQAVFLITDHTGEDFSPEALASIVRPLKFVRGIEVKRLFVTSPEAAASPQQWVLRSFEQISDELESAVERYINQNLCPVIVFIDIDNKQFAWAKELNPISNTCEPWGVLAASLIIAFPEIHWVFTTQLLSNTASFFYDAHMLGPTDSVEKIMRLHENGFITLFDPTGLRNNIRVQLARTREGGIPVAAYVPERQKVAISMDEERDYAFLNAYVAYRFGFRSHVLTSFGISDRVLGKAAAPVVNGNNYALSFEDLYLNFADKNPELAVSFSRLQARDIKFPKLSEIPRRIFVTVGHHRREADKLIWEENEQYLKTLYGGRLHYKIVNKPQAGIFNLWQRAGLYTNFNSTEGRAPGFSWPPTFGANESEGGHSAPGRLLLIAERLSRRAERVLKDARTVPEAVYSALLALEALEYLGLRTPTVSLEALALKQRAEVQAECSFYGVEYNVDVKSRFAEIRCEVNAIGEWFEQKARKRSKLNAEIRIISKLMLIFRAHNQFDEEQQCLARIRSLYRQLWFCRNPAWAWLFWPIRFYISTLLGSLNRFIIALCAWLLIFTLAYSYFDHQELTGLTSLSHGFVDAVVSFIGLSPPHDLSVLARNLAALRVCVIAILLGFVHLGIFVSHLYSILARR